MLYIVASYHSMQFQGKLMSQTLENGKKTSFRHNFGPFGSGSPVFFFSNIWLCQSLDIMVRYHHVQYQKKLIIQSQENFVRDRRTDRGTD